MSRPRKEARLRLRKDGDRRIWVIKDGPRYSRTGCFEEDVSGAEERFAEYLADKYEPPVSRSGADITGADVMLFYAKERVPKLANPSLEADFMTRLQLFWGTKALSEVKGSTCRAYAALRIAQGVKSATARRELETFRAAINFYVKEFTLPFRPTVELPAKSPPRERWLTRSEAARFIAAARARGNHHVARFILIGLYTGTRSNAIKKLQWMENTEGGWIDLKHGVFYRRGLETIETNKRRPPVRIPERLLPHLRRWKRLDGIGKYVIHRDGKPMASLRKAWANSREDAGLGIEVIPHTLRHTCATWGMQNGSEVWELAGYLGMSPKMLSDTYGHHHFDHQSGATRAISMRPGGR